MRLHKLIAGNGFLNWLAIVILHLMIVASLGLVGTSIWGFLADPSSWFWFLLLTIMGGGIAVFTFWAMYICEDAKYKGKEKI